MLDILVSVNLAPLCDFYVNDAFAAAHRSAPSMVAFRETTAGRQLFEEVSALTKVMKAQVKPAVLLVGQRYPMLSG